VQAIAEGATTDLRYKQALELLKSGNIEKAEPLLESVADEKAARLQRDRKEAAAAYRHLGAIAGVATPEKSRIAYGKALELTLDDPDALYWFGLLHLLAGDVEKSAVALSRLRVLAKQHGWDSSLFRAHLRMSEIALLQGDIPKGLEHQSAAASLAQRALSVSPSDPSWRRDYAILLEKMGDIKSAQKRLGSAFSDYKASLEIRQALLTDAPESAELMRELAISHDKAGIIQEARGRAPEAKQAFAKAYQIRQELVERDGQNATWLRDLAASLERNGDLKGTAGQYEAAIEDYRASFAIRERLVSRDPGSYEGLRDLSVAHNKLGDAEREQGRLGTALKHYRSALELRERLVIVDPTNKQRQVDLALSFARLADATAKSGDRMEGLRLYELGRKRLTDNILGTENWVWQSYLREFDGAIAKLRM
jgi:tetratricopeptide (TPR) repeat protein